MLAGMVGLSVEDLPPGKAAGIVHTLSAASCLTNAICRLRGALWQTTRWWLAW